MGNAIPVLCIARWSSQWPSRPDPRNVRMIAVLTRFLGYLNSVIGFLVRRRVDARTRRTELYDRRIAVFDAIRNYMWLVASGNIQKEAEQAFLRSTEHVSFLFGKDIKRFMDEIFDKSGKLHALLAMQNRSFGKALEENLDKQNAIGEWFKKEAKSLDRRFGKYLNL